MLKFTKQQVIGACKAILQSFSRFGRLRLFPLHGCKVSAVFGDWGGIVSLLEVYLLCFAPNAGNLSRVWGGECGG